MEPQQSAAPQVDFTQLEWSPEGSPVTFHLGKRKVLAAWAFQDMLREVAANQGRELGNLVSMYAVIMESTHAEMRVLQVELFRTVTWSQGGIPPRELVGLGDVIDEEPLEQGTTDDIYELMMRSLAVNFPPGSSGPRKDGVTGN